MSQDSPAIRPIEILLVDDNPGDIRLTEEALRNSNIATRLRTARDGVEAMRFLRKQDEFADERTPDLILLDLNLPRKDGREVLAEVKSDASLKAIPVVVLTTSASDEDILRSYNLNANCYITKPVDFEQFASVVRRIEEFWFMVVKLPFADDRR